MTLKEYGDQQKAAQFFNSISTIGAAFFQLCETHVLTQIRESWGPSFLTYGQECDDKNQILSSPRTKNLSNCEPLLSIWNRIISGVYVHYGHVAIIKYPLVF